MTNEKIARINELAKKSKTTGLTDAENNTSIKEPDGTVHKLGKKN